MVRRSRVILVRSFLHPDRGVTLVEAIVSLGLLSVAILLLSRLAAEYQQVMRFSDARDNTLAALTVLGDMRREVEQSFVLARPEDGRTANTLLLEKLRTNYQGRFIPDTGGIWDDDDLATTSVITYELIDERLRRSQQPGGSLTDAARDVVGFACEREETRVTIKISLQEQQRVKSFTARAFLWTD